MAQSPSSQTRPPSPGPDFALDRSSDVPLGTQLGWKLRGAIAAGRLEPGDRLPAVRELAAAAAVNVNTVRAVYARLADQGVIESQHGRGTFVAPSARDERELRALAERTALDASRRGVDPRELAAILFAGGGAEGEPGGGAEGEAGARPEKPGARRDLRTRIARLERELAEIDQELTLLDEPAPATPAPSKRRHPGARILAVDELEGIHESLAMQVAERRVRLELARDRHRLGERDPARASRSVATRAPEVVVGGGTWTLRWRA
ncbi:MAG TPA: GntR family transcriptional regulator [Thermoleophilaceae bacterium]